MARILYVPNASQWSVWQLAHKVAANTPQLESRIRTVPQVVPGEECDVLVCLWWPHLTLLDKAKPKTKLLFISDHYSWRSPEYQQRFKGALAQVDALGVISRRLYWDLEQHGLLLPGRTYVLPDGVDTAAFAELPLPASFTVGWVGCASSGIIAKQKGIEILQQATQLLNIPLLCLDSAKSALPHEQVPLWMQGISVIAWASEAEGTPCPLLEGASCARVPVGTLVGIADEVIEHGKSGLLVDRSVGAFASAFQYLKGLPPGDLKAIGKAARQAILSWDWSLQAAKWQTALLNIADVGSQRSAVPPPRIPKRKALQSPIPAGAIVPLAPEELDIFLPIERHDWCFENIAKQINIAYGEKQGRQCDIRLIGSARNARCQILVAFWWGYVNMSGVRASRIICCVYDHYSWKRQRVMFQAALDRAQVLCVANSSILEELNSFSFKLPKEQYIVPDGVDLRLFPIQPLPEEFIVGWAGNSQGADSTSGIADLKGVFIIEEACNSLGIKFFRHDASKDGIIPHRDMAQRFYRNISVYVCMSAAEGGPNTIKEAGACGRPSVSTRVGDAAAFIVPGSGYLVDRTVSALTQALKQLKAGYPDSVRQAGTQARKQAESWSWNNKIAAWHPALFGKETVGVPSRIKPVTPKPIVAKSMEPEHDPLPRPRHALAVTYPTKRVLEANDKPSALLLSDVRGWAFSVGHKDLSIYLTYKMDFSHYFVVDYPKIPFPDQSQFDIEFVPYTRWAISDLLFYDRCVGALRSSCWFADAPAKPPGPDQFSVVNRFKAFQVVTRRSFEQLEKHCPKVFWLPNPVNMRRFPEPTQVTELAAVWNGNAGRRNRLGESVKGFQSHIVPACAQAGVPLAYAEFSTKRLTPEEMPALYQQGSVFVHASLFEGCSKALLEACASGLAVISTDVGQVGEMRKNQLEHFGDTGIVLVPREAGAIALELVKMRKLGPARVREMGLINRKEVEERWSWDLWAPKYEEFLREALK